MAVVSKARQLITYRAIKSAILKGDQVEYWILKAYDHLDAGLLTEEQVADLEVLAEAYFDEQDAVETQNDGADMEAAPDDGAGE